MLELSYERDQHPEAPGPEIQIEFYPPKMKSLAVSIRALIDSAAVISCVPEDIIARIPHSYWKYTEYPIRGVHNTKTARIFVVDIRIENWEFQNIKVAALNNISHALIGRDLLKNFIVTLDGCNKRWSIDKKNC